MLLTLSEVAPGAFETYLLLSAHRRNAGTIGYANFRGAIHFKMPPEAVESGTEVADRGGRQRRQRTYGVERRLPSQADVSDAVALAVLTLERLAAAHAPGAEPTEVEQGGTA